MNIKSIFLQLYKFAIVGIFGSIFNYIIFYVLLVYFNTHYLIAGIFGFLLPIPIVYIINRAWTFESNIDYKKGLLNYSASNTVALIAHFLTQIFVREILGVPEKFTQLFGIFVSAILNFILAKTLVFKNH